MEAHFSLQIGSNTFSKAAIIQKAWGSEALPPFALPILQFCYDWLRGQTEFSVHTSGSTGKPKAIKLSRTQMQASAALTVRALKLAPGTRALLSINAAYIGGKMMLVRAMEHHLQLTATEAQADPLAALPANSHFDFAALVPLQLEAILANRHSSAILEKMKAVIIGGAPVGEQLRNRLSSVSAPLYSTYGMTETVSHIALKRLNGQDSQDFFYAFPAIKLSQDARGCLQIEGEVTGGEKISTNDVVELIDNHRFRWIGRADSIINSGGIKIQLEKIDQAAEASLLALGIQRKLFAWFLPDAQLGQRLILILEGTPLPHKEKSGLFKQLALRLGKYEQPKDIFYVEVFRETSSGKIQKGETAALVLKTKS